ncbi:MAG: alkaline phosphatase [Clostridia bacterium]|nr:alkaline phosphatase [Clostridia bacterium]
MRKIKKLLPFLCAFCLGFTAFVPVGCNDADNADSGDKDNGTSYTLNFSDKIKNVILLIGDGMGENHIGNAVTYFGLESPAFFADRNGSIATCSASHPITDSAAAATALATGKKVNNRNIARYDGNDLTQISDLAKAAGKKVGVVTTDHLSGATPAAFSGNADDRGDSDAIAATQAISGIGLFMAEAESGFTDYEAYYPLFAANGYACAKSETELLGKADEEKLVAYLPEVRSEYNAGNEEDYQLKEMAKFAVEFLENENGFFLMIESAHIDKYSHSNKLSSALCEVRSLFDTVEYLYDYVADGETALLITADHETGALSKAANATDISNALYGSTGHTANDVPFFIKNCEFTYHEASSPQNTVVFEICKELLGI